MTRKAARKKLKEHARLRRRAGEGATPPWIAMGAFVASTALAGGQAASASAAELDSEWAGSASRSPQAVARPASADRPLDDFRLALVDEALRPRVPAPHAPAFADRADASAAAQEGAARGFDIPSGPLDTVLRAFEDATGVKATVATDSIRPIHSAGVSGSFTIRQAMEQLLLGTNLTFRFTGPSVVVLEFRIDAESVNVTAPAAAVDVNRAVPLGAAGSWLSKTAVRLNGLWQDGGVPGRDIVEQKSQALAPSLAMGLGSPTRVFVGGQFVRQDNVPDYGVPGSAWLSAALTPTTVRAARPVDQSNYYGSVGYDCDNGSQNSYTARVEHDVNRNITVRNQTRYNETSREAVITSIGSPTSFAPATGLVTLSRQGNRRENTIGSNQTSAAARFSTGALHHASSAGVEISSEEQFAPTLGGLGTRVPVDIYNPNPYDPVTGCGIVRTGASNKGRTNTVALYGFDTVDLGAKWQASGGLRWEHYDATYRVVDASGLATTETLTPRRSGNLWSTYRTPIQLTIGGGIRYTDAVFINQANTIKAPSYGVVDGLAEYEVNTHLTLRLNVYNVTNAIYIKNVNNKGGRYNPGNPRASTVTSSIRF